MSLPTKVDFCRGNACVTCGKCTDWNLDDSDHPQLHTGATCCGDYPAIKDCFVSIFGIFITSELVKFGGRCGLPDPFAYPIYFFLMSFFACLSVDSILSLVLSLRGGHRGNDLYCTCKKE